MKYDDLLNVPYKIRGRDKNGFDCYGLVVELCKRAGTPLKDPYYTGDYIPVTDVNKYIEEGINVKEIEGPEEGAICEMEVGGYTHIGYMITRDKIIHATRNFGVRITPVGIINIKRFYKVVKNESDINKEFK